MVRSLAERLHAHEQQKARLAEQEAKLKTAERKARTRRLIEAGGLVDKAGLLDLDANALYGALLSLRDGAGDKDQLGKWTALGGRAFAREARLRDEGKEAIGTHLPRRTRQGRNQHTAPRRLPVQQGVAALGRARAFRRRREARQDAWRRGAAGRRPCPAVPSGAAGRSRVIPSGRR